GATLELQLLELLAHPDVGVQGQSCRGLLAWLSRQPLRREEPGILVFIHGGNLPSDPGVGRDVRRGSSRFDDVTQAVISSHRGWLPPPRRRVPTPRPGSWTPPSSASRTSGWPAP